jgi:hypothetical protein
VAVSVAVEPFASFPFVCVDDVPVGAVRVLCDAMLPLATLAAPPPPPQPAAAAAAAATQTRTTSFEVALIRRSGSRSGDVFLGFLDLA